MLHLHFRFNLLRKEADMSDVLDVVSANLLHGFEQLYLQNPRTGDLCGEWGGNEVSMMLRSLAYVSD